MMNVQFRLLVLGRSHRVMHLRRVPFIQDRTIKCIIGQEKCLLMSEHTGRMEVREWRGELSVQRSIRLVGKGLVLFSEDPKWAFVTGETCFSQIHTLLFTLMILVARGLLPSSSTSHHSLCWPSKSEILKLFLYIRSAQVP
jgi:hypothetical protein